MTKLISRIRLLIFSLFITFLFWLSLEIATRVILSIQTKSTDFLFYGRRTSQRVKHENIRDADGKILYHKCIPSKSKRNPVNSSGFRGKEIQAKKPDSTRIICLGGSTTYGLNLDYKDTYPKLLQDILDVRAGKNRYEVINAGMSALTLPKITSLAENEMFSLKPDIIILMSLINNLLVEIGWQKFSFFIIAGDN